MGWWRIGRGKSSPTITNLNNTIVTEPNTNWRWLTVGGKSVAANVPIPYILYVLQE